MLDDFIESIAAAAIAVSDRVSGEARLREQIAALKTAQVPTNIQRFLRGTSPLIERLPFRDFHRLCELINVFLGLVKFRGAESLEVTDEMRASVAGQACLLLLNRSDEFFHNIQHVVIYPGAILGVGHMPAGGLFCQSGTVYLSWKDVVSGGFNGSDGHNVVIHEFAHLIDNNSGRLDGAPLLHSVSCYRNWEEIMAKEYSLFCSGLKPSTLNPYGKTNRLEFFAVATEAYFEMPNRLKTTHPRVYDCLDHVYRSVDCRL